MRYVSKKVEILYLLWYNLSYIGAYFNGRMTVSKTVNVGSTPTAPAIRILVELSTLESNLV